MLGLIHSWPRACALALIVLMLPLLYGFDRLDAEQQSFSGVAIDRFAGTDPLIIKFVELPSFRYCGLRQGNLVTIYTRDAQGESVAPWMLFNCLEHELNEEDGRPGPVHSIWAF